MESSLPGRLRLLFPRYRMLPESSLPYHHYAEEILLMLPGVRRVQVNSRIGTVLVLYDPSVCTADRILRWVEKVVDAGIEMAREPGFPGSAAEQEIALQVRKRLKRVLSGYMEENRAGRRPER